eukprot:Protomagalhaensia_wolfi_Nauph_80__44@NODE_1026_length_1796_cov_342_114969_g775_i0_p1_GENE_NODE_1026_length_1796_cov_342_114969_g775_i0NODE_1026_length_1796_cov_342_114969_g775_i0_p1_ORF_typecomplete_len567_score110_63FAD_binding_1/PF00667_20/9_8e56NAD_binding_1/PF00175_21/1_4e04NAD_binding_1/PF00175_21/9_7e11_NODE_1026_length_1796_cov_342_114969_g775_i0321702
MTGEKRTLCLVPLGGPLTQKLCRTIRAFAEARDLTAIQRGPTEAPVVDALLTVLIVDEGDAANQCELHRGIDYAILGVRQSQACALLEKKIAEVEAQLVMQSANIDESTETFEIYMDQLFATIGSRGVTFRTPQLYSVQHSASDPVDVSVPVGYKKITVKDNVRLTSEDYDRPSHMLTFNIEGAGFTYGLGDHVTILPRNEPESVERAAQVLKLNLDEVVSIKPASEGMTSIIPSNVPVTVRSLLTYYLDIQGLARRKFIATLSLLAADQNERKALHEMATRMDSDSPYKRKLKSIFSNIDVVEAHPSVKLSLSQVLSVVPPIHPRCYSASSSPLADPNIVQCTFVVLSYPTQGGQVFKGLSTNYLCNLTADDNVAMTIRKGFKEVDVDTPNIQYVACALGSGIALLRGISQHFAAMKERGLDAGHMLLYYGVRHAAKDFIFKEELEEYQAKGVLTMYSSFSHDQEEFITPATKIKESPEVLAKALVDCNNCKFIYCGPSGPAYQSVENAIKDAVRTVRPDVDPDQHITKMKKEARYEVQAFTPAQDPENPFGMMF